MPPIGETLREARMRQRLDIADVEERTKIRAKYLRALENEEWGLLPGPTFVRTFLRTYAEVVGVDPHLLLEEYRANHEPRTEQEIQPLGPPPGRDRRRSSRRAPGPPRRGIVFAGLAVLLIGFLLLLGLIGDDESGDPGKEETTGTVTTQTTPRAAPRTTAEPRAKGVTVRVVPSEPTYACVDRGAGTDPIYQGTLATPRTFRGARVVRLNLGKRTVRVLLDGEQVEFPDGAEPLGLALRAGGASEVIVDDRPCA